MLKPTGKPTGTPYEFGRMNTRKLLEEAPFLVERMIARGLMRMPPPPPKHDFGHLDKYDPWKLPKGQSDDGNT